MNTIEFLRRITAIKKQNILNATGIKIVRVRKLGNYIRKLSLVEFLFVRK